MPKLTRLDEVIRKYTKERAAARRATARPQTNRRDPQADIAAALKMRECALRADELMKAGKIAEARKALKQAELWRRKAGIQ